MWKIEVKKQTKASEKAIWALWTDVEGWNKWDEDVQYASIKGDFVEGTIGILKPKEGPKTKFKITKAIEYSCFTNRSSLPLCTIDFIHEVQEAESGILVIHRIEMNGLLSGLFSKLMGKNMAKGLPKAVDNLIKIAEDVK